LWFANHGRALVYVSACDDPPLRAFTVPAGGGAAPAQQIVLGLESTFLGRDELAHVVWSADGTRIAYPHQSEIWSMAADGTGRRRLTAEREGFDECPSWSPDGGAVVYQHRGPVVYPFSTTLSIVSSDGRSTRRLAVPDMTYDGSCPIWGPALIALRVRGGIATVAPDGASELTVRLGDVDRMSIGWLADGTLAYALWSPDGSTTQVELHMRGSTTTVTLPLSDITEVAFSPDGTAVAVLGKEGVNPWYDAWTVGADGINPVRVTNQLGAYSIAWG
jgi:hypothetical protein